MLELFSLKSYDGEELVANYVPCKNAEGVMGAYDVLSGEFLDRDALVALIEERLMNADSITIR